MPVTAVSLFSGCGGFDLGARSTGVQVLWANDVYSRAAETHRNYLPEVEFVSGDIRQIDKQRMPEADLLIGYYPCQGFSAAAWRRWKDRGERDLFANKDNFPFLAFVASIPAAKPKFVFIENVRGLVSSANGWFFQAQTDALESAGYAVYAQKVNLKDYGAPQSRRRVFIVGVREDLNFKCAFGAATHGPERAFRYRTQRDAIEGLPEWPAGEYKETRFHGHYLTRNRKKPWESYSYTIVAHSHHVPLHPMGEPMVKVGRDDWALQGSSNRRLSWRECARLQCFDDGFEPSGGLDAKYAQIGNAVPPLMGRIIVQPAVDFLNDAEMRG
ncbi:MAG: DNA cytosine methyltransferase [Anaerolineae bacterium]|nr:DNA cytosine methyltransferase [Anaerolineae bacterium]